MGGVAGVLADFISPARANCTVTNAITTASTTDGATNTLSNRTTGSFTPANNDLLFVWVAWAATTDTLASGTTVTVSSSTGTTFTQIATAQPTSPALRQLLLFVATALSTNTSQTITAAITPGASNAVTNSIVSVNRIAGMRLLGSSAVRQSVTGQKGGGLTPTLTFSNAAVTNDVCIAAIVNGTNPAAVTQPSSWTQVDATGSATPVLGLESSYIASGFTSTVVTWGSTTPTIGFDIIAELDNS